MTVMRKATCPCGWQVTATRATAAEAQHEVALLAVTHRVANCPEPAYDQRLVESVSR